MANHSSNITGSEVWALIDSPHYVDADITIEAGGFLTVQAGCELVYTGAYALRVQGRIVATGSGLQKIQYDSNVLGSKAGSYTAAIIFDGCETGCVLTYSIIKDAQIAISYENLTTGNEPVIQHMELRDNIIAVSYGANGEAAEDSIATLQNSWIHDNNIAIQQSGDSTTQLIFNTCQFNSNQSFYYSTNTDSTPTYKLINCLGQNMGSAEIDVYDIEECYTHIEIQGSLFMNNVNMPRLNGTTDNLINGSIFCHAKNVALAFLGGGNGIVQNNDFIGSTSILATRYAIQNGGNLINCYIAGFAGATIDTYDDTADEGSADDIMDVNSTATPPQFVQVDSVTGMKSSRNYTFQPTGVIVSTITTDTATISWTTDFRSKHRVELGTVSGTYNILIEPNYDWSNYDGIHEVMTITPSIDVKSLLLNTTYYGIAKTYDPVTDTWNMSGEFSFVTEANPKVQVLDAQTNELEYIANTDVIVTGNIELDSISTDVSVVVQVKKLSDDDIETVLLDTLTNFATDVTRTLDNINGGPLVFNTATVGEYYIELMVSGGTPPIAAGACVTTIKYPFNIAAIRVSELDITTSQTSYSQATTVEVDGNVMLNSNAIGVDVLVEIRKKSDDSLVTTVLSTTTNFVANISRTLSEIYGGYGYGPGIPVNIDPADDYYAKVTINGGTPIVALRSSVYGFSIQPIKILQLDIRTDRGAYDPNTDITLTGTVKLNSNISNVHVVVEARRRLDDSVVATIVDTFADFTENIASTLNDINGGSDPVWSTTLLDSYYVKITLSGGTPLLDSTQNNVTATYGFVVATLVTINYPVNVSIVERQF